MGGMGASMKRALFCLALVALWGVLFRGFLYLLFACVSSLVSALIISTPLLGIAVVTAIGLRALGARRFLGPAAAIHLLAIALFIVVVPDILGAIDRKRQRESMKEMKQIASSIEEYRAAHGSYAAWPRGAISEVLPQLPQQLPRLDAWCTEYEVASGPEGYVIVSYGKDGERQLPPGGEYEPGTTTDFDDDIVLRNGEFLAYPEGMQP